MVESLKIELFTAQRELVEKQEECEMIEKEITLVRLSLIALYIILAQDNLATIYRLTYEKVVVRLYAQYVATHEL